jgi:hypothetical protein
MTFLERTPDDNAEKNLKIRCYAAALLRNGGVLALQKELSRSADIARRQIDVR